MWILGDVNSQPVHLAVFGVKEKCCRNCSSTQSSVAIYEVRGHSPCFVSGHATPPPPPGIFLPGALSTMTVPPPRVSPPHRPLLTTQQVAP